jgi:hypothetical protein
MNIFYYIYYRVSLFYIKMGEAGYEIFAMGVVSCCQFLNILSILAIICYVNDQIYSKSIVIVIGIPIFIINSIILSRKRFQWAHAKWESEPKLKQKIKDYGIITYILGSIILAFYSMGLML